MTALPPRDRASGLASGALILAVLCWGLAPVATRYLLAFFTPLQLVITRFAVGALLLLVLLTPLRRHRWHVKEAIWILFCGLIGVIGYNVPMTYGLRIVPAGMAGLLIATEPIWIILLTALVVREKISWSVLLGLLLALVGIALLFGQDSLGSAWNGAFLGGTLLVLLGAVMWSIYTVAVRSLSKTFGARLATALTVIVGTLPLLAWWDTSTWPLLLHLSALAWMALALLALGSTVAATILWNYGVVHSTGSRASLFLYLIPLISVTGGVLFLHEPLTLMTLISGVLIVGGVVLAQIPQRSPRTEELTVPVAERPSAS